MRISSELAQAVLEWCIRVALELCVCVVYWCGIVLRHCAAPSRRVKQCSIITWCMSVVYSCV